MNFSKNLNIIAILTLLYSCSPTSHFGSSGNKAVISGGSKEDTTSTVSKQRTVPGFQNADLGTDFNTNTPNPLSIKPQEDASKVFIVQLINAYRPIWLNLATNASSQSSLWKFYTDFTTAVDKTFSTSFSLPKQTTSKVSIYQALPNFAATGPNQFAASQERGDSFKIVGHTFAGTSSSWAWPNTPTAVVSLYYIPYTDSRYAALAPPHHFEEVKPTIIGPQSPQNFQACTNITNTQKGGGFPNPGDVDRCNLATQGAATVYDLSGFSSGNTTGLGDLNSFLQMQTLVLWQPVPASGYQCLGMTATNTEDPPSTSQDAGGPYAQYAQTLQVGSYGALNTSSNVDYPIYCVQQQYLSPGKLVPLASNGQLDFYAIAPADDTGLANMNLFYAVAHSMSNADRQKIKVWVLNSSFVKLLPNLILSPSASKK